MTAPTVTGPAGVPETEPVEPEQVRRAIARHLTAAGTATGTGAAISTSMAFGVGDFSSLPPASRLNALNRAIVDVDEALRELYRARELLTAEAFVREWESGQRAAKLLGEPRCDRCRDFRHPGFACGTGRRRLPAGDR